MVLYIKIVTPVENPSAKVGHLLQEALTDHPSSCYAVGFAPLRGPLSGASASITHDSLGGSVGPYFTRGGHRHLPCLFWDGSGRTPGLPDGPLYLFQDSFCKVQQWLKDLEEKFHSGEVVVMLVGNKTDLEEEREVTLEVGLETVMSQEGR